MKSMRWVPILVIVGGFSLPAAADKPQIQWNDQYDFSSVQTFQWQLTPETSLETRNPFMHSLIKNSLEAEFSKSGLTQVESDPDVYINYHASTETEVQLRTDSYGYGWGGYGGGWGGYYGYGMSGPVSSTTRVVEYQNGTLVVDVWDADSMELIWRGAVTDTIPDDVKKAEKTVNKAIVKLGAQSRKLRAKAEKDKAN